MSVIELRVIKRWRRYCLECGARSPEGVDLRSWHEAHMGCGTKLGTYPFWRAYTELTIYRGALRIRDLEEPGWIRSGWIR